MRQKPDTTEEVQGFCLDFEDGPTAVRAAVATTHPAPWWYRLAARLFPGRCREIPEANNPDRVLLRQFAIIKRRVYLQNFASGEDPRFMHSHQWRRTFAVGLWGGYIEHRLAGPARIVRAPYAYTMGPDVIHQVVEPTRGHTSLFVGFGRDDSNRRYFDADAGTPWEQHVKRQVKRI